MPSVGKLSDRGDQYLGYFSVLDFASEYPDDNCPMEAVTLLSGDPFLYLAAWKATRRINRQIRGASPPETMKGFEVHEIIPIVFGGNPTDLSNRMVLPEEEHAKYTGFWAKVKASVEQGSNWKTKRKTKK